ncbi:class I SAM-dependent methyltransferase [Synechocystis sp. PCC 7339]|uniref:class I SAM-dependent methyltransferase n=1 Tax=Synechocystis sp. PCC 7339 TaxID=2782213 RepID=UPI001CBB9F76|nr:class I SAM-dependent methyltransferase [Synechocystis sp. PCC 7339]UAJ73059.1 class I SAM-dependent methyltransferase [Synechocystis sp. PCC 7339]
MAGNGDRNYLDKTLQQFESYPYPDIPIEDPLNKDVEQLYKSSLVTARYRRDKKIITDLEDCAILDVACGTGATTLQLAWANPGAKIVGVDISPESVKIAEKRLRYHGFENTEFHVLAIADLNELNQKFDLINASDVLYLLPNLALTLKQLAQVLQPDGVLRGNLHSYYQRFNYYRAQTLFQRMGLMEDNPEETELGIARGFYAALRDEVNLKATTWSSDQEKIDNDQWILMNHLFQNDKGYTLPELFDALAQSDLALVDMVDWQKWDWRKLFKEPDNLPAYLAMGLENADREEQLCFYELVQPDKRLLDFWCSHPLPSKKDFSEYWLERPLEEIIVHLHPRVENFAPFRQAILDQGKLMPLNLSHCFPFIGQDSWLDRTLLTTLYAPLLESSQTLESLVSRFLRIRPFYPADLTPVRADEATKLMIGMIAEQEEWGLLMLEAEG